MIKNKFKLSALAIVVSMAANGVYAAEQTAAEKKAERKKAEAETEVIVVTGIKDSLGKALSYKRHADFGMDAISAEDIGKLPDVEIGDVLERIAGVQVNRGDDGVVNGTNIRGLPGYFNRTLYNGRVISTSLSTERFFDSQVVPAAFMNRVEVHKTAVSDVPEGGLAGVVNLKSIRAFDVGKRAVRLKATASNPSNNNEVNTDLVGIYSNLFLDETLGFSAGINHLEWNTETQKSSSAAPNRPYVENPARDYNGDGETDGRIHAPASINFHLDKNYRERTALFTNLEWRPGDDFRLFGEVFYSSYDTNNNRSFLRFRPANSSSIGEGAKTSTYKADDWLNTYDYLTAIHPTNSNVQVANQVNQRESDIAVAFIDAEWILDRWSFKLGTNLSKSKTTQFQLEATNMTQANYFDVLLDGSDTDSAWALTFTDPEHAQNGLLNTEEAPYRDLAINAQQIGAEYESNNWGVDFDAEYEFEVADHFINPTYLQFGVHYAEDESLALKPKMNFGGNNADLLNGAEFIYSNVEPSNGDWFDGTVSSNGQDIPVWAVPDVQAMIDKHNWTPNSVRAAAIERGGFDGGSPDDLTEDIGAIYARLNFENNSGNLIGNVGLRYVHTKQVVTGVLFPGFIDANPELITQDPVTGAITTPDGYMPQIDVAGDAELSTHTRSYDNYLPSLNLRYLMGDDDEFVIRSAWSRTMSRPKTGDLRITQSFNSGNGTVSGPDPDLDAFISENVDLGVEWYYDKNSALTFALFYKDIKTLTTDDTIRKETTLTHEATGIVRDVQMSYRGKVNSTGTIIQGTTIGFEQPFTALPSFLSDTGIKVNYTYLDNSEPDLMTNVSKNNLSATLYYDTKMFDARLSYTYRDERVRNVSLSEIETGFDENGELNGRPPRPATPTVWVSPSSSLNASFSYKPSKYLNFNFGVSNITDDTVVDYSASGTTRTVADSGRIYSLSVTTRL